QCAAEDIPHIFRVGGPVGAELEFHDDAGGDADAEDECEDADPETDRHFIDGFAGLQVKAFEDDDHQTQSDTQRGIDIMEADGESELDPGKDFDIHNGNILFLLIDRHIAASLPIHHALYHGPQSSGDLQVSKSADRKVAASLHDDPLVRKRIYIDIPKVVQE